MLTLQDIYGSKIFKASNRKDQILSAFNTSGMSAKLVIQSPDSVEAKYRKYTQREDLTPESDVPSQDDDDEKQNILPSKSSGSHPSGGGRGSSLPEFDDLVDVSDVVDMDEEAGPDVSEPEPSSEPVEPVEESTEILGVDGRDTDTIKSLLNSSDSTSGVTRVKDKSDEVWVYYSDDTNLNNIMVDVIEVVQQKYNDLEFNRLARSENAIVFQADPVKEDEK